MVWSDSCSVGIKEIDNQHKQIFVIIANYQRIFKHNRRYQETYIESLMGKTLLFLVNYTSYHFEMEEDLMKKIEYPFINVHKVLHRTLLTQLTEILIKLKNRQSYKPIEFYYFVTKWLTQHIFNEDKQIGKFYQEKIKFQENDKIMIQNAEDILNLLKPKFFRLAKLLKNNLIDENDWQKKRFNYIDTFYAKIIITNKQCLFAVYDSLELLKNKGHLSEEEKKHICMRLKNLINVNEILQSIKNSREKLSVLEYLFKAEVLADDMYDNFKSDVIKELD